MLRRWVCAGFKVSQYCGYPGGIVASFGGELFNAVKLTMA
jgi:hypothetical protein